MAEITAGMVKSLRETTGVGMMDCKAALAATNGDMEAAVDWLRAKGLAKAAKKSTRVAAEGLVGIAVNGTTGAAVERLVVKTAAAGTGRRSEVATNARSESPEALMPHAMPEATKPSAAVTLMATILFGQGLVLHQSPALCWRTVWLGPQHPLPSCQSH